jgi:hypothetical protein
MIIHKIWTTYKLQPDGTHKATDWVEYGPDDGRNRIHTVSRINDINALPDREAATDNPAVAAAYAIWDKIRPAYEAFKTGEEMPENGTPLAAWPGVNSEQVAALKAVGIRSVEEFAEASDSIFKRLPFPNPRQLRDAAKMYLEGKDRQTLILADQAKADQIQALQDEMREMREMMAARAAEDEEAPRRRGRPPKAEAEAAA